MIQFDLLAFSRILADAINILLYIPLTLFTSMTSYSSTVKALPSSQLLKNYLYLLQYWSFMQRSINKTAVFAETHKTIGVCQVPKGYH